MVTLADAVFVLFPNAVPLVDYVVSDIGAGPFISHWNEALGAQPTAQQIAAVTEQQVIDARAAKNPEKRGLHALAAQAITRLEDDRSDFQAFAEGTGSLTAAQLTTALRAMAARHARHCAYMSAVIRRLVQVE